MHELDLIIISASDGVVLRFNFKCKKGGGGCS